jgi:Family of unknown function (DUF5995)
MSGATTIDEVLAALDRIIATAIAEHSRVGFFAALYRQVTLRVKQGIADGMFDDGPRMERLDTAFASRYLDALEAWDNAGVPTKSWRYALNATRRSDLIILQHLLLGINAHIILDLGVAAAQVAPGDALPSLHDDFQRINQILGALTDDVKRVLEQFSPLLHLVDGFGGTVDDAIVNFSLSAARDDAWLHAQVLAGLPGSFQATTIFVIDTKTALLARLVADPGRILTAVLDTVNLEESDDIPAIIQALNRIV